MMESPVLKELVAQWKAEAKAESLLTILEARFGPLPADVCSAIRSIHDLPQLDSLIRTAARCEDIDDIRAHFPG